MNRQLVFNQGDQKLNKPDTEKRTQHNTKQRDCVQQAKTSPKQKQTQDNTPDPRSGVQRQKHAPLYSSIKAKTKSNTNSQRRPNNKKTDTKNKLTEQQKTPPSVFNTPHQQKQQQKECTAEQMKETSQHHKNTYTPMIKRKPKAKRTKPHLMTLLYAALTATLSQNTNIPNIRHKRKHTQEEREKDTDNNSEEEQINEDWYMEYKGSHKHRKRLRMTQHDTKHNTISILTTNIRTLTAEKFENIKEQLEISEASGSPRTDIIILFETHTTDSHTYHYLNNTGWTIHTCNKPKHKKQRASGGIALLSRDESQIRICEPPTTRHSPTQTQPELGIATWKLQNDSWTTDLTVTANYWPKGPVPATERRTATDHIHHLHNILEYRETKHGDKPHIAVGDFNLHLATKQETHLEDREKEAWGSRIGDETQMIMSESEESFWYAINNNKYTVASTRTTSVNKNPYTFYKNDTQSTPKSITDYVLANKAAMHMMQSCEVLSETRAMLGTDHDTIQTIMKIPIHNKKDTETQGHNENRKPTYKLDELKNQKCREAYIHALQHNITNITQTMENHMCRTPTQKSANDIHNLFIRSISQAADKTIPRNKTTYFHQPRNNAREKKREKNPFTAPPTANHPSLREKKQQTKDALSTLRTQLHKDMHEQDTIHKLRQTLRIAHKNLARHTRRLHNTETSLKFQQYTTQETGNMWKHITQLKNKDTQNDTGTPARMKNLQGIIQPTDKLSAECFHEARRDISGPHKCKTLQAQEYLRNHTARDKHNTKNSVEKDDPTNTEKINTIFTIEEMKEALHNLPIKKATGSEEVPYELFKVGREILGPLLLKILNHYWTTETHPNEWDKILIRNIYKSKGDRQDPKSYRAICLINATTKIFESVIRKRIQKHIEETKCISEAQYGYKKNCSASEAIYTLAQIIQIRKTREQKATYICFIDFKTAFPAVCRPALYNILHEKGIKGRLWRNIKLLYKNPRGRVLHPHIKENDTYNIETGLTEGSKLSPILYTFYINTLIQELESTGKGVHLKQRWMGALLYADDLALIAKTPEELQQMINTTQEWAKKMMATININKTKIVAFHEDAQTKQERKEKIQQGQTSTWTHRNTAEPTAREESIEETQSFPYLGVPLDANLTFRPAATNIRFKIKQAQREAGKIGLHPHGLHTNLKITLWKQIIQSAITHIIPFVQDEKSMLNIQHDMEESIKEIFISAVQHDYEIMPKLIMSDLGIPSAHSLRAITHLRMHAQLSNLNTDRPSAYIHHICTHNNHTRDTHIDKTHTAYHIRSTLNNIQENEQWERFAHTTTQTKKRPHTQKTNTPTLKTSLKHWVNTLTLKVLQEEHKQLETYTHTNSDKGPTRKKTYYTVTQSDRTRSIQRATATRSPFQPALYITHTSDPQLTENLLRLRTQSSPIPAHQAHPPDEPYTSQAQRETNRETGRLGHHVPYSLRFCRNGCNPHPDTWTDNIALGPDCPQGTEQHLLMECPKYTTTEEQQEKREGIENNLSLIMTTLTNTLKTPKTWHSLNRQEKTNILLAAAPPQEWKLSKEKEETWSQVTEEHIAAWIQPILTDAIRWLHTSDPLPTA